MNNLEEHKLKIQHAISICNRLSASSTKAKHISRLFSQLNKVRAKIAKVSKL